MHLDARKAGSIAIQYVKDVVGEAVLLSNIMVEEVDVTEDGNEWLITVGYSFGPLAAFNDKRHYKIIHIHDSTSDVRRMRIRPVDT